MNNLMKTKLSLVIITMIIIPIVSIIYFTGHPLQDCVWCKADKDCSWLFSIGDCGPTITTHLPSELIYVIYAIIIIGIIYTIHIIRRIRTG